MSAKLPIDTDTSIFPVGFSVYYFNKWANFETKELQQFFSHLSGKELLSLKQGDIVWIDEEPYVPNGKVHGYTKRTVSEIEILSSNSVRIGFGRAGFFRFSPSGLGRAITKVNNELALKEALQQLSHFAIQLH